MEPNDKHPEGYVKIHTDPWTGEDIPPIEIPRIAFGKEKYSFNKRAAIYSDVVTPLNVLNRELREEVARLSKASRELTAERAKFNKQKNRLKLLEKEIALLESVRGE